MDFLESIESFVPSQKPIVMTLGNFDGVHTGHQYVIQKTFEKACELTGVSIILTFRNHPSQILPNKKPILPIYSPSHKIMLLSQLQIDTIIQIPFTHQFSQQTPLQFLKVIKHHIPFQHLILGYDTKFGKNQTGDKDTIKKLSKDIGFTTEYLEPISLKGEIISSSRIREFLQDGNLQEVEFLLGRKFSIMGNVTTGNERGKRPRFPTLTMDVSGLCLPPFGVYRVRCIIKGKSMPAIAYLDIAPATTQSKKPILEVLLSESPPEINNQLIEVLFDKFISLP